MNEEQQAAVRRVLEAQDYVLLLGMPGTGKTTTIAAVVAALVARGSKVLLTSFTNTAVDNMVLKLKVGGRIHGSCVRLQSRGHRPPPEIEDYVLRPEAFSSVEELRERLQSVRVVATTCQNTSHALLRRLTFDVCIVDEASQVLQPLCLEPLSRAPLFVLVGDHNQLPPLVVNPVARAMGMDESLFKRLSEAHPGAIVTLRKQYRMNDDIMTLSNDLFDPESTSQELRARLESGCQAVAERCLALRPPLGLTAGAPTTPWILEVLRGGPWRGAVLVDSSALASATNLTFGSSSPHEAAAAVAVSDALLRHGLPACDLACISPFKAQARLLSLALAGAAARGAAEGIEEVAVDTVDRFQGRDKECVILSLVSHNAHGEVGKLLLDWRRINVALTRAKSKLVIVGSAEVLASSKLLQRLIHLLSERGAVIRVPAEPDSLPPFARDSQGSAG